MAITQSENFPGVMRIGNTVTASIQLFRTHFRKYYLIAFNALLWNLVPALVDKIIHVFSKPPQSTFFVIVANLALLYFWAKYMAGICVVFRMAFNELISRSEEQDQIRGAVSSKKWSLIWVNIPGLILILGLILVAAGSVWLVTLLKQLPILNQGLVLFAIPIVWAIALFGLLWALTRFSVAYLLLIFEEAPSVMVALKRSWTMTKGSVLRLVAIYTLSLLVAAPFIGLSLFLQYLIRQHIPQPWLAIPLDLLKMMLIDPFYVVLLGLVGVFAYIDLISRREGADLNPLSLNAQVTR